MQLGSSGFIGVTAAVWVTGWASAVICWVRDPSVWCFTPQATEDQIKLLRLQRHLQEDFDKPYLDLSLHNTVSTLIQDGHHKKAEQLYREFKIPDKRWVWNEGSAGLQLWVTALGAQLVFPGAPHGP